MIPYSDASGAAFPLAVLWLYQRRGKGRWDLARWFAMGLLTYVGFQIKPQLGIPAIAVVLTELVGLLGDGSRRAGALALAKRMGAFALAMAVGLAVMTWVILPASRIELDREKVVGPAHFFMMGLREETCGGYSGDDVLFSTSFATAAERQAADLAVAGERRTARGPGGLLRHLSRKTAFVYGDGSFAWGIEGQFYHQLLPERDGVLSPFFRGIFYGDGENNPGFVAFQQVMWMGLLTGMWGLIVACLRRERLPRELMAAALTVLGLTAFTLLFEARARYLYAFAGIYVLLGTMGWRWLLAGKKAAPADLPTPEGEAGTDGSVPV